MWSLVHVFLVGRAAAIYCMRKVSQASCHALCKAQGILLRVLVGTLIPILKMRKLRHRGIVQDHTGWSKQDPTV